MLWRFIMLRCPCTMAVTYKKLFHLLSDKGMTNADLMEKAGMIVTPGTAFGNLGEGYVRIALVYPVEMIEKAIKAVADSGILKD